MKKILIILLIFIHHSGHAQFAVPDTAYVLIPANPSFTFITDLSNRASSGEPSPIRAPYVIGKYLVTNADYAAFTVAAGHPLPKYWKNGTYPEGKAKHPVLWIAVADVNAYCRWLSKRYPGWLFRLPTEAEWEYAAAGPQRLGYPWGNDRNVRYRDGRLLAPFNYNAVCAACFLAQHPGLKATYCNPKSVKYNTVEPLDAILSLSADGNVQGWIDHAGYTGFVYTDVFRDLSANGGMTSPVGAYPAGRSFFGCYDMAGNAFEWTSSTITANNGAEKGKAVNAIRGGSWYANGNSCKSSYRGEGRMTNGAYATVGFRLVAVPVDRPSLGNFLTACKLKLT